MTSDLPCLLDGLMPFTALEESGLALLDFEQSPSETVVFYAVRYRHARARFTALVELFAPGCPPWEMLCIIAFQRGLTPAVQCLQEASTKPATSLREAIDQARRNEAYAISHAANPNVLRPWPVTPNANDPDHASSSETELSEVCCPDDNGGNGRRGRRSRRNKRRRRRGSRRPRCTYPGCRKLGHTVETCFQKERDENSRLPLCGDDRKLSKKRRNPVESDSDDDDEEM